MSRDKEYVDVDVLVVANPEHKDAVLLSYEGEEEWVPRSLMENRGIDLEEGEEAEVAIEEWKADNLGWS